MKTQVKDLKIGLEKGSKGRAFKPIVPGHERGKGVFIGPEDYEAHKRQREAEAMEAAAEIERKKQKKDQAAEKRAQEAAEKEKRAQIKAGKRAQDATADQDVYGPLMPSTISSALSAVYHATDLPGPSNYADREM